MNLHPAPPSARAPGTGTARPWVLIGAAALLAVLLAGCLAPAATLLARNLLIYGVGGLIVPFIGIKLIDLLLVALRLA